MGVGLTLFLLTGAGVALVMQNILMMRITASVSTVLITLVINSAMGLALLLSALVWRSRSAGIFEIFSVIRPWMMLPGLLGSFFVFAGIVGYQRMGAATTIAVLVASQLVTGLIVDLCKVEGAMRPDWSTLLGAMLLIAGAILIVRTRL